MPSKNKTTNDSPEQQNKHEHPLPQEINKAQKDSTEKAHQQADADIADDPDLSIHSPNDDLDEGETARLGEDKTDII